MKHFLTVGSDNVICLSHSAAIANQQFTYSSDRILRPTTIPSHAVGRLNNIIVAKECQEPERVEIIPVDDYNRSVFGEIHAKLKFSDFYVSYSIQTGLSLTENENDAVLFTLCSTDENDEYLMFFVFLPRFFPLLGDIFYLNLDHRLDRRVKLMEEIQNIRGVSRIPAIYEKGRGWIGCAKSHIYALTKAIEGSSQIVTIIEDDFAWKVKNWSDILENTYRSLVENNIEWDFFLLAAYDAHGTIHPKNPDLMHIESAQTTCGYIVNGKQNMKRLKENFEESLVGLELHVKTQEDYVGAYGWIYAIDQHWKKLQKNTIWLMHAPSSIAGQRRSYSDIEHKKREIGGNIL